MRRLTGAKTLVIAAASVTVLAIALLAGLVQYSRAVVAAGAANSISEAPASERSLLVRGSAGADPAELRERDEAVRREVESALSGIGARVFAAGYATGRQLTGDTGDAIPDDDGLVFASVVFAEGLEERAELVAGEWPQPGQRPTQTAIAAPVAEVLGIGVGDRIPLTNRLTDAEQELTVSGVWQPRDPAEPYWRIFPSIEQASAPQSSTYGPFLVHRDDFMAEYLPNASAGWLVDVDLSGADLLALQRVAGAVADLESGIADAAGLASSGLASTDIPQLAERLERADLVGRSALLTPMLLVIVLSGYALLLIAVLLNEHRRTETALMRARGAARSQIAGLVTRESLLVVLPAVVLAPLLAAEALEFGRRLPTIAMLGLPDLPVLGHLTWLIAAVAALACAVAMVVPALRRTGTYVEELAAQSRPSRWAFAQRAALDLALIAFAVIAWLQLRQHESPLSGVGDALGIDPLLSAAPTIAVLAGALVALRLLPWITRVAERRISRTQWNATLFGVWQAGRRPHAGPVLLLALAVAVSTLALCMASTAERSLHDQADYQVGADLRLVEAGTAPPRRLDELDRIPGIEATVPAMRDTLTLGPDSLRTTVLAVDAAAAPGVVQMREDLANGSPDAVFARLAEARIEPATVELPPSTTRLTGVIKTTTRLPDYDVATMVQSTVVLADRAGGHHVLTLGRSIDDHPLVFAVDIPTELGSVRLAGFGAELVGFGVNLVWELSDLTAITAEGTRTSVRLSGSGWQLVSPAINAVAATATANSLIGEASPKVIRDFGIGRPRMTFVPRPESGPLAAFVTPGVLGAFRANVGDVITIGLRGTQLDITVIGTVTGVPTADSADAILLDLPTLTAVLFGDNGVRTRPQEWWLSVDPSQYDAAVAAAGKLADTRVLDRASLADAAGREPFGAGARAALWVAAGGAMLLALVGIAVDVRATARRRLGEFAVLRTLGAGTGLLSRALLAEQSVLAGLGVVAGLLVGVGVASTMAPLVILTPSAGRPEPPPLLAVPWLPVGATAGGLLAVSLLLGALVAASLRQRLIASQLRIGEGR